MNTRGTWYNIYSLLFSYRQCRLHVSYLVGVANMAWRDLGKLQWSGDYDQKVLGMKCIRKVSHHRAVIMRNKNAGGLTPAEKIVVKRSVFYWAAAQVMR